MEIRVPLGTHTGWNLRATGFREGNLCGLSGSYMPFAQTKEERQVTGDPRLSIEERYKNHAGYVRAVERASRALMRERFLIQEDADRYINAARASDVLRWVRGSPAWLGNSGRSIVLFENEDFRGSSVTVSDTTPTLSGAAFSDRPSSMVVQGGQWEVCEDDAFGGRCVTLGPGRYPTLTSMGLARSISSVRSLSGPDGGGGVAVPVLRSGS
jgi:hypothetical protein